MIDIHTHILPQVDDGARNLQVALKMARMAVKDGITHMFATPHSYSYISRHEVAQRVERLQTQLQAARIPLIVIPGYEVRLSDDMFQLWAHDQAGPLGQSRYVLAEPSFYQYDKETDNLLFELFERGYLPIMAHPERIRPIQKNLSLLDLFLERGGLVQITAESLTQVKSHYGAYQIAVEMLRQGMVHIIASDAHDFDWRPPILSKARKAAAKIVGREKAKAMVTTNPQAVLDDEMIVTD